MLVPLTLAGRQRIEAGVDLVPLGWPVPVACGVVQLARHPVGALVPEPLPPAATLRQTKVPEPEGVDVRGLPDEAHSPAELAEAVGAPRVLPCDRAVRELALLAPEVVRVVEEHVQAVWPPQLKHARALGGASDCMVGHAWQP